MTGSSWICGEETLGMEPCRDPTYPLRNKLSLPRMIIAQMDSIQCDIILKKSGTSVLRQLLSFIYSNNPANWFTIYLVIFMLLHEISHSTKDRRRHAQQNRAQVNTLPCNHYRRFSRVYSLSSPDSLRSPGPVCRTNARRRQYTPRRLAVLQMCGFDDSSMGRPCEHPPKVLET